MPDFGVDQAHQRVLAAVYAGKWETVGARLTALKNCDGEGGSRPISECLDAVRRLR